MPVKPISTTITQTKTLQFVPSGSHTCQTDSHHQLLKPKRSGSLRKGLSTVWLSQASLVFPSPPTFPRSIALHATG